MFGIEDTWVALVFVLCLASSALCVIYSLLNWNTDDEVRQEDIRWAKEEAKVEEKL